jgi:hypothetical protein
MQVLSFILDTLIFMNEKLKKDITVDNIDEIYKLINSDDLFYISIMSALSKVKQNIDSSNIWSENDANNEIVAISYNAYVLQAPLAYLKLTSNLENLLDIKDNSSSYFSGALSATFAQNDIDRINDWRPVLNRRVIEDVSR